MKMEYKTAKNKIVGYSVFALAMICIHYILDMEFISSWRNYLPLFKKLTMSLFIIALILIAAKIIESIIVAQTPSEGDRYNLLRITRLLSLIFILIVSASFIFQNLYAAAVSFGLISLVLGFALQSPITSFIAWLYIVFRRPYQVGNRIQISDIRGDVIEISYLDTIILECSGDYLENDRRSGRVVHFPNSLILKEKLINYSGPQLPFIWNETPLQIAFASDLPFVEQCLLEAANADFEGKYPLIYEKKIDDLKPAVYFRVNQYAWLEAVISYPVEPKDTTDRRNRILKLALNTLNAQAGRVQFPEGNKR